MFDNLLNRGLTGGDTDPMLQQAFFEAPNGCIQPLVYPCLRFLRDKPLLAVVLVVHRRQCLKQLDILAAVYGRVSFGNIFSLELVDGISGFLVVVADPVHLVSDFKPINPSAIAITSARA